MIAAYIRVSSGSQNAATQRAAILRAAKARRETVRHWFSERARRDVLRRDELGKLRAMVKRGEIRKVYVFALDRFTEGIRATLSIVEELREGGAELVSLHDPFPLNGPEGDVAIAALAWAAQRERQRLNERLRAARARVEREGGHWGRPRRVGPADERRIRELARKSGLTSRWIAGEMGIPEATVRRVMRQKGPYGRTAKRRKK
jgi:DNA invertase Pin-like site-specific DNA recombinase